MSVLQFSFPELPQAERAIVIVLSYLWHVPLAGVIVGADIGEIGRSTSGRQTFQTLRRVSTTLGVFERFATRVSRIN